MNDIELAINKVSQSKVSFQGFSPSKRVSAYFEGEGNKPFFLSWRYTKSMHNNQVVWLSNKDLCKMTNAKSTIDAVNKISKAQKVTVQTSSSHQEQKELSPSRQEKSSPPKQEALSPSNEPCQSNPPNSEQTRIKFYPRHSYWQRPFIVINNQTYIFCTKTKCGDPVFGAGAFKTAKLARPLDKNGKDAIVLIFRRERREMEDGSIVCETDESWRKKCKEMQREIDLMNQFQGPNFLKLIACVKRNDNIPKNNKYYIVVEKCSELSDELKSFDKNRRDEVSKGIISAVALVHKQGYLHRDIKMDNILIGEDGQPKLSDFGGACAMDDQEALFDYTSTIPAPEQAKFLNPQAVRLKNSDCTTKKSDSWPLGYVLYTMHHKIPGTDLLEEVIDRKKYKKGKFTWKTVAEEIKLLTDEKIDELIQNAGIADPNYREVIRDLLRVDPNDRIDAATALERLSNKTASPSLAGNSPLPSGLSSGSEIDIEGVQISSTPLLRSVAEDLEDSPIAIDSPFVSPATRLVSESASNF